MSDEVAKIPKSMWPIYYRMHNFSMLREYERIYKPQAELIASIVNPDVYKTYAEMREKELKVKLEGGPQTYTISDSTGVRSASKADTYYDPEKGLVDFNGKVLISKEEYLKRSNEDGLIVSL